MKIPRQFNSLVAVLFIIFGLLTVGYACVGMVIFVLFGIELPTPFYWSYIT